MHLRSRETTTADFVEARKLLTDGFLYDDDRTADLFAMWQDILEGESGYSGVVTASEPGALVAFGISVAIKPQFVENFAARPRPFVALQILEAWKRGDSPIMTREELAQANAGWGVDIFVLHHGYAPANESSEYYGAVVALAADFVRQHAGLNLRSMMQEFYDRSWLDMNARFGFLLRHDFADHPLAAALPLHRRPFLCGIRRSEVLAHGRGDFPNNALFRRFPAPRLGLDSAQRRSLREALDEALDTPSRADGWSGVYDRIAEIDSSLPAHETNENARLQHVISWMRSHPEELHPYPTPGATQ